MHFRAKSIPSMFCTVNYISDDPHLQQYERRKTKSVPPTNHPPEQKESRLTRAAHYLCPPHTPPPPSLIGGDKTLRLRIVKREKFITRLQLHDAH
ncbi:hypothetical protein CDAR_557811 [Caerostris darwini]|uniref:Uncharacterized protein n=1 Tax=Caerostris darwini TaxID=1538125 RepID=A0AAV4RDY2_9ARAC|nr:hypothetical protein CDAR_557811 [Caerostris darwini]